MRKFIFFIAIFVSILFSCSKKEIVINKSSDKKILSFSFNSLNPIIKASIDSINMTITAVVPKGTDVTNLSPIIVISDKATISPLSGETKDFTKTITYTVSAEDGSRQEYKVNIELEKVLINSNPTLFISDNNNIMYAIDATNGKEKWSFSVDDSVFANPLFNNGILYFGAGSYSGKNNTFFALDSKTGDVKWKFPHNNGTVRASPVIYQGRIYFGVSDKFFVLDAITGQLIKTYDAIDVYKACIYDGNLFYTNSQFIQKINLADGQEETIMAFVYNANSFFIMNNVLYASGDLSNFGLNGDGDIRAFNILNNELIWSKKVKNLSYSTLKYANESIYYTDKQSLYQIDVKKGITIQSIKLKSSDERIRSLFIDNSIAYITGYGAGGKLFSFNLLSQNSIWSFQDNAGFYPNNPTFFDNSIYISNFGLSSLDKKTGQSKWYFKFNEKFNRATTSPYIVTNKGEIFDHTQIL